MFTKKNTELVVLIEISLSRFFFMKEGDRNVVIFKSTYCIS